MCVLCSVQFFFWVQRKYVRRLNGMTASKNHISNCSGALLLLFVSFSPATTGYGISLENLARFQFCVRHVAFLQVDNLPGKPRERHWRWRWRRRWRRWWRRWWPSGGGSRVETSGCGALTGGDRGDPVDRPRADDVSAPCMYDPPDGHVSATVFRCKKLALRHLTFLPPRFPTLSNQLLCDPVIQSNIHCALKQFNSK